MDFAVVEPRPGLLDFVVNLRVDRRGNLSGTHWMWGSKVEVPLEAVVHVGMAGNNDHPPMLWQWCPAWTVAAMRRAQVPETRQARRAANPGGWEPASRTTKGKVVAWRWAGPPAGPVAPPPSPGSPWVPVKAHDEIVGWKWQGTRHGPPGSAPFEQVPPPGVTDGLWYTTSGKMQHTVKGIANRRIEQERLAQAFWGEAKSRTYQAPIIDPTHYWGHYEIQGFLHDYRRGLGMNQQNVLFALMFGALTANESTATAEKNIKGLAEILNRKFKEGAAVTPGALTRDEFSAAWSSGLGTRKWKALQRLLRDAPRVYASLTQQGLVDRELRSEFVATGLPGGLGLIKFSFALECLGQDVACLDRWMFRGLGLPYKVNVFGGRAPQKREVDRAAREITATVAGMSLTSEKKAARLRTELGHLTGTSYWPRGIAREIAHGKPKTSVTDSGAKIRRAFRQVNQVRKHNGVKQLLSLDPPYRPFSDEAWQLSELGIGSLIANTPRGLGAYEWFEGILMGTQHYAAAVQDGAPNPVARAQWTFWEDIMRAHPNVSVRIDRATHSAMFVAMFGGKGYLERMLPAAAAGKKSKAIPILGMGKTPFDKGKVAKLREKARLKEKARYEAIRRKAAREDNPALVRKSAGRRADIAWQVKTGSTWRKQGFPTKAAAEAFLASKLKTSRFLTAKPKKPPPRLPAIVKRKAAPRRGGPTSASARGTVANLPLSKMPRGAGALPDLRRFAVILVNSSSGKDSQAMLTYVVSMATKAGVKDRIVVVHADLGRVEWKGARELAIQQAVQYGVAHRVCKRPQGDLLEHVEQRGMWPGGRANYCTSDHKRGQVAKEITALAKAAHEGGWPLPVPVLNCIGIRAEESPARSKRISLFADPKRSSGRKAVTTWYPIFRWTDKQVWDVIRASGVPYHEAYDLGMPRLSCVFCVFAGKDALQIAAHHNRKLFEEYAKVERKIGHTFKKGFSLDKDLRALLKKPPPKRAAGWRMNPVGSSTALVIGYIDRQIAYASWVRGRTRGAPEKAEWAAVAARWVQLRDMVRAEDQAAEIAKSLPAAYRRAANPRSWSHA